MHNFYYVLYLGRLFIHLNIIIQVSQHSSIFFFNLSTTMLTIAFKSWQDKLTGEGNMFNMHQELCDYCQSDVRILHQSCKIFGANFVQISATPTNPKGRVPFLCNSTLLSAYNLLFRTNYLKPNMIALILQDVYKNAKDQSIRAQEWLIWESLNTWVDHIKHAYESGEQKIPSRFVDRYGVKDGVEMAYSFLGVPTTGIQTVLIPMTTTQN